jgi:hypothetical protein
VRFKRRRGAVQAKVDAVEATVLSHLAGELLALLADEDDQAAGEQDPLAAMVGMPTGEVTKPRDPGLARLLPDAYGDDTPEGAAAAKEFRRYTESDLRAGKRADATVVLASLAPLLPETESRAGSRAEGRAAGGGALVLDRDQADAWMRCLNDLRLVLGTRLEVSEETALDPAPDDPAAQALHVYGWLGWLQETLVAALDPRPPGS